MDIVDKTAPTEIWLSVGDEGTYQDAVDNAEVCWCPCKIDSNDIKYVIASEFESLRAKNVELEATLANHDEAVRRDEREACAIICDDGFNMNSAGEFYAKSIRARGDK